MQLRFAVADPLPLFRRGVSSLLTEMGLSADAPNDVSAWLSDEGQKVLLLTLAAPEDWALLEGLSAGLRDRTTVIALLIDVSLETQVRVVRAGASVVVARDATAGELKAAVGAAVERRAHLPADALRAAVDLPTTRDTRAVPTADERGWLQELASGTSVGRLAKQAGYSERMMFRILKDLYTRLGADSRTQALMQARASGWI